MHRRNLRNLMSATQEPKNEGQKLSEEKKALALQKDEIKDISSMSMITPVQMIEG